MGSSEGGGGGGRDGGKGGGGDRGVDGGRGGGDRGGGGRVGSGGGRSGVTCNCFCSSQALYRPGRQCSPGLEIRRSGGKDMVFRRPLGYRSEQEQDGFSLR